MRISGLSALGRGLLLAGFVFAGSSRSDAASVDITVARVHGTTQWNLEVDNHSSSGIGIIDLNVSSSLGPFTTSLPIPPPICALGPCPSPGDTSYDLALSIPISVYPPAFQQLVGPFQSALLGYFSASTSSAANVQVGASLETGGLAAFDTNGTPLDFAIHVVPEPANVALVGLALGSLALARARLTRP